MPKNRVITTPFSSIHFLKDHIFLPKDLSFSDAELRKMDKELARYEQISLTPDLEKIMLTRNELNAPYAISKAENSSLTLPLKKQKVSII